MKRVIHILNTSTFSGAENVVCQIISMLREENEVDSLYCCCDGPIRDVLKEKKIRFIPINELSVKEVKRVIKEYNPAIVHAHDRKASLVAALACGKTPCISHIHYNPINTRSVSLKAIAYLFAGFKADHIFWVSQSSFDGYVFNKLLKRKSTVLYNIIDVDDLQNKAHLDTKNYRYDIVYVGRLDDQKNPVRLIRVCKYVSERLPNVKVAIVGSGSLEKVVREKVNELNLFDNVEFLGYMSNPLKVLHDSKVMLMTSKYEGTPMCALEALALGVPVVSTPVDGLKVLIYNGENGYLEEEDQKLAQRLVNIIELPELRDQLAKKAVALSRSYNDIDKYKKEILTAYRKCF